MRFFGSAIVALIVLWFVDRELSNGHYTSVVLTALRGIARSIGYHKAALDWRPVRFRSVPEQYRF
jgi:hypothetical protein